MRVAGGATGSRERLFGSDLRNDRVMGLVRSDFPVNTRAPGRPVHTAGIGGGRSLFSDGFVLERFLGDSSLVVGIRLVGELHRPTKEQRGDSRNATCPRVAGGQTIAVLVHPEGGNCRSLMGFGLRLQLSSTLLMVGGLLLLLYGLLGVPEIPFEGFLGANSLLLGGGFLGIHNESSFSKISIR